MRRQEGSTAAVAVPIQGGRFKKARDRLAVRAFKFLATMKICR
jgi:hypothetical protein